MNKNGICNIFSLNSMEKYVVNETVTKSLSFSYILVKKSCLTLKLTSKKTLLVLEGLRVTTKRIFLVITYLLHLLLKYHYHRFHLAWQAVAKSETVSVCLI